MTNSPSIATAHTVIGVFADRGNAERALEDLKRAGIPQEAVSWIAPGEPAVTNAADPAGKDNETGRQTDRTSLTESASSGAFFGGLGGLLIGLVALAIPGLGPVIAAGPLATALIGAGAGAVGGSLIGYLNESGVPQEEADAYAASVRNGRTLLSVRVEPSRAQEIHAILVRHDGQVNTYETL